MGASVEAFLTGLKVGTQLDEKSIMDILREGDPNSDNRRGRAMVLREILHDDRLGFQRKSMHSTERISSRRAMRLESTTCRGSPAMRRSLNQAIRIVGEVVRIAGKAPAHIFIEVTRDDDMKKKGSRTKRRYDNLKDALANFKEQDPQWTKRV